jgi:2-oxo-4-hydroxy-4-carboxy-5-ureidoimidazoline decarboxylase
MSRITLDELNQADASGFVTALGDIFEHAPWVAQAVLAMRPFPTLAGLFDAMKAAVLAVGIDQRLALIKQHPDLADKAARAGQLTAESMAEQSSIGFDRLSEAEYATFHHLNNAYRAKFGIPFIVCVRRHMKDSILRQYELRLQNDTASEHAAALDEIFRIAALRLDQRVSAPDRLKVNGRLSTHVLDTSLGRPARDVAIELVEVARSGDARLIKRAVTNADGRTDQPLIAERPIPIGSYELRFNIGDYFARQGVAVVAGTFFDVVPVRFVVAEPEAEYHVPLLMTPWSYSTYRGS